MPKKSAAMEQYLLELNKIVTKQSLVTHRLSNMLYVILGAVFLVLAHFSGYKLPAVFFAIFIILGIGSFELYKHSLEMLQYITRDLKFQPDKTTIETEQLSKYNHLAQICSVISCVFGVCGIILFIM